MSVQNGSLSGRTNNSHRKSRFHVSEGEFMLIEKLERFYEGNTLGSIREKRKQEEREASPVKKIRN